MRERVAGNVLDVLAARPDDRAVRQDDFQTEHGVARLAVFDAAQAARIGAEIPADRAHLVRRGIRRVEQPLGRHSLLEIGVDDPGLGENAEVVLVDLEDAIHLRERDREAAVDAARAP